MVTHDSGRICTCCFLSNITLLEIKEVAELSNGVQRGITNYQITCIKALCAEKMFTMGNNSHKEREI